MRAKHASPSPLPIYIIPDREAGDQNGASYCIFGMYFATQLGWSRIVPYNVKEGAAGRAKLLARMMRSDERRDFAVPIMLSAAS